MTLALLQELLNATRANDADGYNSWLALGIQGLGRDDLKTTHKADSGSTAQSFSTITSTSNSGEGNGIQFNVIHSSSSSICLRKLLTSSFQTFSPFSPAISTIRLIAASGSLLISWNSSDCTSGAIDVLTCLNCSRVVMVNSCSAHPFLLTFWDLNRKGKAGSDIFSYRSPDKRFTSPVISGVITEPVLELLN